MRTEIFWYITPYRRRFGEVCCMHVRGTAVKVDTRETAHFNETSIATIRGGVTSPNLRPPPSGKGRKYSIFQTRAKSASILPTFPTDAFSRHDFKLPPQCSSDHRIVAIRYQSCGTTYRPHLQASRISAPNMNNRQKRFGNK